MAARLFSELRAKMSREAPTRAAARAGSVLQKVVSAEMASASSTAALLRAGASWRRERMRAADMISLTEAARFALVKRVTIRSWIKTGRAIGVEHTSGTFKLPRWQFEPPIWAGIQAVTKALGTTDGWQLLTFIESPSPALGGLSPRAALEQGTDMRCILAFASAEAH